MTQWCCNSCRTLPFRAMRTRTTTARCWSLAAARDCLPRPALLRCVGIIAYDIERHPAAAPELVQRQRHPTHIIDPFAHCIAIITITIVTNTNCHHRIRNRRHHHHRCIALQTGLETDARGGPAAMGQAAGLKLTPEGALLQWRKRRA